MSNKPREWPNVAREARDRSAELAAESVNLLEPIVDRRPMSEMDRYIRVSMVLKRLQNISRHLEAVGACTRPA